MAWGPLRSGSAGLESCTLFLVTSLHLSLFWEGREASKPFSDIMSLYPWWDR